MSILYKEVKINAEVIEAKELQGVFKAFVIDDFGDGTYDIELCAPDGTTIKVLELTRNDFQILYNRNT